MKTQSKPQFLNPEPDDEHRRPFHLEVPHARHLSSGRRHSKASTPSDSFTPRKYKNRPHSHAHVPLFPNLLLTIFVASRS